MKFRWTIAPAQPLLTSPLAGALGISPLLAQCLLNRGVTEPETISRFLNPRLKQLADPFAIPNMHLAVERLMRCRQQNEPLVIFGDYDVDGVTSTTLLAEVLGALGWTADVYLPCRFEEGYGLSRDGVENCLEKFPAKLLLAVDCGSTAVDTIQWLATRGVDVIVLDHHQVSDPAPVAVALVNPQLGSRQNETGEFRQPAFAELCSVGLAFKLVHALVKRLREEGCARAVDFDLRPLLDLVALGTIADIVPLIGENRPLVSAGLEKIKTTARPGLMALKAVAKTDGDIGSYEVGFQLGPRLNAAGRLESAEESLRLLKARTLKEAEPLAHALDARNRERQKIERSIAEEVIGAIRARFNPETDFVIVEGQLLWHIGVVGIVASRVVQEFYRPTLIVGADGDQWRGSGRSIEGFDLAAALRDCDDLLIRHGGHAMAAGVTVKPENLDALRQRLNELARRSLRPELLKPALRVDAEVSLPELTLQAVQELARLQPHGPSNPQVHLVARNLAHHQPPQRMGKENQHVKFRLACGGDKPMEAVWWNCGDALLPKVMFDLAFVPQINEFNGRRSVQLKVLDWQPASAP